MSEEMKPCPKCQSPYGYSLGNDLYSCSECGHEWNPNESNVESAIKVLDSNGNELNNGDSVIIIKNLPVKGAPKPIKAGTKVKNIRLTLFFLFNNYNLIGNHFDKDNLFS